MRTNIVLDDELVAEAMSLTGITTKREVVHQALEVLVQTRRRMSLLDLRGKVSLAEGYDHLKLREDRIHDRR